MRRRLLLATTGILLVAATSTNAYFLQDAYRSYRSAQSKGVTVSSHADVKNAKEESINSAQEGIRIGDGKYAYETRDKSKIDSSQFSGKLLVASNTSQKINYLLATGPEAKLTTDSLSDGWNLDLLSDDAMWAPGACASKPTYFVQGKYVFIDDGKTSPDDKYNSYVVFDLQTEKFLYFGGDNFTDEQATQEKILAVVDQNDQMVFYIDHTDRTGPLAGSSSFKHARGSADSYIVRRVINLATLHYTDYKLSYTVPADKSFGFYFVSNDGGQGLIDINSDGSDTYYVGTVHDNQIQLAAQSLDVEPPTDVANPAEALAKQLTPGLDQLLPAFLPEAVDAEPNGKEFNLNILGSHDDDQYLVVNNSNTGSSTPLIYNQATKYLTPMTTQAVLDWGNYVALGVF